MNISLNLGTDIIEINRIKKAIEKNQHFKKRVYTESEIKYCEAKKNSKYASYAGIYSAKEAFFKALGTGFRKGNWHDVEIYHDELGAPFIKVSGIFAQICDDKKVKKIIVSISHCHEYATSQVILI